MLPLTKRKYICKSLIKETQTKTPAIAGVFVICSFLRSFFHNNKQSRPVFRLFLHGRRTNNLNWFGLRVGFYTEEMSS
uniref:Uncharacterized protein n=1 Tax=Candidatus Kentrum sp. TUN TaxID=2126343 RepID=A0A451A314_9GAMM|nr:MAG: hypothetical protein BECKTUN1418F_GA0071002_12135 [Candidatus Kentron sp. TUN]VFK69788.1 MAG: hypothetical protein BECKTUN1418E_GA0071001_12135 [Candidatus Kentron sp. TUN]